MTESWEQLQEYIQQLKYENEDLAMQLAMANDYIEQTTQQQYQ